LLTATTDFDELNACDAIIICVPTPLRKTKEPDVSYILAAAAEIKRNLRRGQLVILESTTYPGTTDEVLLPIFEETGLKLDEDFLLAFSPERVDPGNPQFRRTTFRKSSAALRMIRPRFRLSSTRKSSTTYTPSRARASQKLRSCWRILSAPSTSAWQTRWRGSATPSTLIRGK
jgi:hypothetical protein